MSSSEQEYRPLDEPDIHVTPPGQTGAHADMRAAQEFAARRGMTFADMHRNADGMVAMAQGAQRCRP